ncbi:MAG: slipin family protein [Myxococcaceae bacterium]|nr:slipin family protein [Myxococcaceae bacterium]
MRGGNPIQLLVFLFVAALAAAAGLLAAALAGPAAGVAVLAVGVVGAWLISSCVRVVRQWEIAVVLRLGRFRGLRGPGLFLIIPVVDSVTMIIDRRTVTTPFRAEKTLTLDTVPVDVDAVLFWRVIDPMRAALEVEQYAVAVQWSSQTALRDVIGRSSLATLLSDRRKLDDEMRQIIDERTGPWGIVVGSVEIRDVRIPLELQSAMSRQAQAERERQARVILAQSEVQIAERFAEAAERYTDNPTALHLRAMNMLYEGLKERGALMIIPSSAVESMSLGGLSGMAALGRTTPPRAEGAGEHTH